VPALSLRHISKTFGALHAVEDISFDVAAGEFFSILGPSGCGKTTLLRMIAGFESPTGGSLLLREKDITGMLPQHRGIGMVFQNYALFPHMTVFQNVAFGLETQKRPRKETEDRVERVLTSVGLHHKAHSPVTALSGGEQQRVAVARAVVVEPAVLLFDEPLSNLDVTLRASTRKEIRDIQRRTGITTVYVTHDQAEALTLSDRIAVMNKGRIEQIGTPRQVYESPVNEFVAGFIGGATIISGFVDDSQRCFAAGAFKAHLPEERPTGPHTIAISPEAILINRGGEFSGKVVGMEYEGFTTTLLVETDSVRITATGLSKQGTGELHVGESISFSIDWSRVSFFSSRQ
jgi:ABC-type Fe3+/spermidine/putrescine transport system ATPase subunit